jgi:hypothetical protein
MQQRTNGDYKDLQINPRYTYQLLLGNTRRAVTNPDSIGITNRKPPVLMIAKSVKKSLEAPNPQRRRINLIDPDGNEGVRRISFPEGNGILRTHVRLII